MITATDSKGKMVFVTTIEDCDENQGGLFCQVYADRNFDKEIDNFCVHPDDCDCGSDTAVEAFVQRYVKSQEYDDDSSLGISTVEDLCTSVGSSLERQEEAQQKIEGILIYLSNWGVINGFDEDKLDRLFSDKQSY